MASFSDDFVTLTQLNCVQQCSALLQSPKPRNYLTAATLLGLYCGVLIYRSYRSYLAGLEAKDGETQNDEIEEVAMTYETSNIFDVPIVERHEFPLPNINEPALMEQHSNDEVLITAS
ncbi:GH24295 [Drosophila grimshawi]|uniref:GH24295 n=1 Tax=Drosophila grimshawi TaxID=7222 RepID=B4JMN3_DROGR|nr:GH24295 [Drosophila grimshawi]